MMIPVGPPFLQYWAAYCWLILPSFLRQWAPFVEGSAAAGVQVLSAAAVQKAPEVVELVGLAQLPLPYQHYQLMNRRQQVVCRPVSVPHRQNPASKPACSEKDRARHILSGAAEAAAEDDELAVSALDEQLRDIVPV